MQQSRQKSKFVQELIWGWPVILFFFPLAASQFVIAAYFGKGWGLVAAIADLAIWFLLRPWRFGLLPADSRRSVFINGTVGFIGWVLRAAMLYWKI